MFNSNDPNFLIRPVDPKGRFYSNGLSPPTGRYSSIRPISPVRPVPSAGWWYCPGVYQPFVYRTVPYYYPPGSVTIPKVPDTSGRPDGSCNSVLRIKRNEGFTVKILNAHKSEHCQVQGATPATEVHHDKGEKPALSEVEEQAVGPSSGFRRTSNEPKKNSVKQKKALSPNALGIYSSEMIGRPCPESHEVPCQLLMEALSPCHSVQAPAFASPCFLCVLDRKC